MPIDNGTLGAGSRHLSTPLYVDCALIRERFESKDAMIAAHTAVIDTTERQLVFQVMGNSEASLRRVNLCTEKIQQSLAQ